MLKPQRYDGEGRQMNNGLYVLFVDYEKAVREAYISGSNDAHKAAQEALNRMNSKESPKDQQGEWIGSY